MEQLSLFDMQSDQGAVSGLAPLADRMRPQTLEDYVGQSQLLGEAFSEHAPSEFSIEIRTTGRPTPGDPGWAQASLDVL